MPNGRDNAMTTVRALTKKFCSGSHETMANYSTRLQHLQPGQQGKGGAGSISSNFWPAIRQRGVPMLMAGNLGGPWCPMGLVSGRLSVPEDDGIPPGMPLEMIKEPKEDCVLINTLKCFLPNSRFPTYQAERKIDGHTDRTNSKLAKHLEDSNGQHIETKTYPRWWSGGVAGAIVQSATAPLDLLESRMVTIKKKIGLMGSLRLAIRENGFLSLYDGLSAQVLRQLSYTTLRFHLYELGKKRVDDCSFLVKVTIASMAGCLAGVVGIPLEVVNTRMQVDRALPIDKRWNYRHVFDGLYRVGKEEGYKALYSSFVLTCVRAAVVTAGQNAIYEQAKGYYIQLFHLEKDSSFLQLLSSMTAVCIFGPIIQPLENLRTIKMVRNIGMMKSISYLMRLGPLGPFRGMVPSMLRLMPNTIMTLLLYEKIRATFGYQGTPIKGCRN